MIRKQMLLTLKRMEKINKRKKKMKKKMVINIKTKDLRKRTLIARKTMIQISIRTKRTKMLQAL